jgi:hypothetical protein
LIAGVINKRRLISVGVDDTADKSIASVIDTGDKLIADVMESINFRA